MTGEAPPAIISHEDGTLTDVGTTEYGTDTAVLPNGLIAASEWADIIEAIQNNPALCNLTIQDVQTTRNGVDIGKPLAICYTYGNNASEAIISFSGTTGYDDWYDNVRAITTADTPRQKAMLEYVDDSPYDSYTLIGQSKGSNYAQYVGITSDKVTRVVGIDGQGQSAKFIKKYAQKIKQNAWKITNYSVSTDFVNQLLFAIPGATQTYVKGVGITSVAQNHSPNSLLSIDEDGRVSVSVTDAPEEMGMLRDLSTFIMNAASDQDLDTLANCLGDFAGQALGDGQPGPATTQLLSDEDGLATLIAYVLKYRQTYNVSGDDIRSLMQALGADTSGLFVKIATSDSILDWAHDTLTDDNRNHTNNPLSWIPEAINPHLAAMKWGPKIDAYLINGLQEHFTGVDIIKLLNLIAKKYAALPTTITPDSLDTGDSLLSAASALKLGELLANGTIKVSTEVLIDKADTLLASIRQVEQLIDTMASAIRGTSGFWVGDAGDAHRLAFLACYQEAQDIFLRYRGHVTKLKIIAGLYDKVEADNLAISKRLPNHFLF